MSHGARSHSMVCVCRHSIHGTTAKNAFDTKKIQIGAVYVRDGGFQPNMNTAFGSEWMSKSRAEINALSGERG